MVQIEISHEYRPRIDLYFREDRNRWMLDYWLPPDNQKRMTVTLPKHYSKVKATKAKEDKYAQLKEGKLTEKEVQLLPSQLSIDEAIESYKRITFLRKTNKSKEYDANRIRVLFKFFKETCGYDKFHQIGTADILKFRQYLEIQVTLRREAEKAFREQAPFVSELDQKVLAEKMRTTGLAPATARGMLRDLKKIFNGLFLHKIIHFNSYRNIPSLIFSQRDLIRTVTPKAEELQRLLNAPYQSRSNVDFPIKEFVEFLAETGARDDEAIHLEWPDIENGVWHIRSKPDCPTRFGIGWAPKWGKERRVVLSPRAIEVLSRLTRYPVVYGYVTLSQCERLKARMDGRKAKPVGYPAQFVFSIKDYNPDNQGGRRRVEDYGKTWTMLLRKAGLPDFGPNKLHPHDFRRYKNKQDEYKGKSVRERSETLGHSQEVNQSSYRGEDDDQILALKAKINQLRYEISQSFKAGDTVKVGELMNQESAERLKLAILLGNDVDVLFRAS